MDFRVPNPAFELTIIGPPGVISTSAAVKIVPDLSIEYARSKLDEFDILVVPGGPPPIVFPLVENNSEVLQIVRDFGHLPHKRTILSICTGALFLGASGLLDGLRATTHHLFLDELRKICGEGSETEVVSARYVDGGLRESGLRVITGGGVSSGLDSACYFVSQSFSPEMASFAAKMSEFSWIPQ
jgi:transcriptional regulator GlxA family with amidase domain